MRIIVILTVLLSVGLWANSTSLFGKVINISQNDVLNVRSQADYRSKKVAVLQQGAYVGIEKCKKVDKATWCRVYPMVQQWYENFGDDSHKGWVNARYLICSNRGYVIVKGKKNCDYVLRCNYGKCEVVYEYITDNEHNVKELKTKWIEREYLKGESQFGVTPDNEDGFCNTGMFIEDYLQTVSPYN
ncbi:SH3 domain-containing protein [Sulfurovum sp. CS9]|uniref:SH3 domain-containing protein n=1 Tax=Sulfurovum sp. CS9 TaxID=3391146 RepID=UPI0039EA78E9